MAAVSAARAASRRCPRCGWPGFRLDMYCTGCGERLFEFEAQPSHALFYVDFAGASEAQTQPVYVSAGEWGEPDIVCEQKPDWVTYDQSGFLRIDVRGEQESELPFGPEKVVFRAAPSSVTALVEVAAYPAPELLFKQLVLPKGITAAVAARLGFSVWSPIVIESVKFDPNWIRWKPPAKPSPIYGNAEIMLEVQAPASQMSDREISYSLRLRGLRDPVEGTINLQFQDPPKMAIKEVGGDLIRMLDCGGVFSLHIENRGAGSLEVKGASLTPVGSAPAFHFVFDPAEFTVASGKTQVLQVIASAAATAPGAKGLNLYNLEFDCNDPAHQQAARERGTRIAVKIVDATLDGFAAVDYGTTDTTAAYYDFDKNRFVNICMEPPSANPKIYSNIYYQVYRPQGAPRFLYSIGDAARFLRGTQDAPQRLVQAIKVKLGMGYSREIYFKEIPELVLLSAEEIATDILEELLRRMRRSLGKHPLHFVLCVPTRFTMKRRDALRGVFRAAAERAGIYIEELRVVDESLAAGVYALARTAKGATPGSVTTAMTVDFGGGTTDITVFRVKWGPAGGERPPIGLEIIGAWGDPTMGGEEITTQIARVLFARYAGRAFVDKQDDLTVRSLIPQAESVKLAVSEIERVLAKAGKKKSSVEDILEELPPAALAEVDAIARAYAVAADKRRSEMVRSYLNNQSIALHHKDEIKNVIKIAPQEVAAIFNTKIDSLHDALCSLLATADVPGGKVDVLLLAGQSSQFPTVEQKLSSLAKRVEYVTDESGRMVLKECVSRGALLLAENRSGIPIEGQDKIWTTLGHAVPGGFNELISWGTSPGSEAIEFTLGTQYVNRGVLRFTLKEKTNLTGELKTEDYAAFELDVGAHPQDTSDFLCRVRMEHDGSVKVECQLNGVWRPMRQTILS